MDNDVNIEEQCPVEDTSEESAQLPINFLKVGSIDNTDVKVYIHQAVYAALEEYSRSDIGNELGSILLGEYSTALGHTAVMVSEFIEAKYTDASASTLTFTHETWDYIHSEQAEKWPKLRIVGWQHTHPGYGIFLSNYDMFIQENFFNLPFQIAYVVDPKQNTRGFFCWKNGHVEKLNGYYIYDEPGKIIVPPANGIEYNDTQKGLNTEPDLKMKSRSGRITAALTVACIALFASVIFLGVRLMESNKQIEELFNSQHKLNEQIQSLSVNQNSFNTTIDEKVRRLDNDLLGTQEQLDAIQKFVSDGDAKDAESEVSLLVYIAQEGDTLQSICESFGLNYERDKSLLLRLNGLSDEEDLSIGQSLLILQK